MSVLIKGMEMPKNCDDCLLDADCPHDQSMDGYKMQGGRPRTCPLVPIPTHGRLIDADALIAKLNMMIAMAFGEGNTAFHFAYRSLGKVVENAPTIIQAEEGE